MEKESDSLEGSSPWHKVLWRKENCQKRTLEAGTVLISPPLAEGWEQHRLVRVGF